MDINTIVIEPRQGGLDDVVIHVPFRLINPVGRDIVLTETAHDLFVKLRGVEDLNKLSTAPVDEHSLRIVVSKTAGKINEVFAIALMYVIDHLDISGIDELQLQFADSVSRKLEKQLSKILRRLAAEEWEERHDEELLAREVRTSNCRQEVERTERVVANNLAQINMLDASLITAGNELRNAKAALKRAQASDTYDEDRLLNAAARVQRAKAEQDDITSKLKRRLDQRDTLDQRVTWAVERAAQNDIEFHELSEAKRPKFEVGTGIRRDTVTLVVVG